MNSKYDAYANAVPKESPTVGDSPSIKYPDTPGISGTTVVVSTHVVLWISKSIIHGIGPPYVSSTGGHVVDKVLKAGSTMISGTPLKVRSWAFD